MSAPKPQNLPLPPFPEDKFGVISLDPPWHFNTRAAVKNPESDRSPQKHYPTMDLDALKALPIKDLALPEANILLWITGPLLVKGVHNILFKAWGVKPSAMAFVWAKTRSAFDMAELRASPLLDEDMHFGMGFTTRQNAEYVALGTIGSPGRARADIRQMILDQSTIVAPVREHSRKPEEYYRRVEHYCKGPRLDMFGGAIREGWTHWGWGHRKGEAPGFSG